MDKIEKHDNTEMPINYVIGFQVFVDFADSNKKMLLNFAMKNIIRNFAIANTNIYFQCPLHIKSQSLSTTILT